MLTSNLGMLYRNEEGYRHGLQSEGDNFNGAESTDTTSIRFAILSGIRITSEIAESGLAL